MLFILKTVGKMFSTEIPEPVGECEARHEMSGGH